MQTVPGIAQAGGKDAKAWLKLLSKYREPNIGRSIFELAVTAIPLLVLSAAAWVSLHYGFWPGLLLILPAGGFLLRLFMIQHDCGHGSFFGRRRFDDWTGRIIGILTLTPYDYWRRAHAIHHSASGNLDERGMGDITTLTLTEYRSRGFWGRLSYRLYRHPLVMFGIGPIFVFLFKQRLPFGMMRAGAEPWISTMATNLAIACLAGTLIWWLGLVSFLIVYLPIVLLAATIGIWLFYVQHQFEETHWSKPPEWKFQDAALHGSSYYVLPRPLQWMTANIGIHHVHHLSSRVPYYRLSEVLENHPELSEIGRITIRESIQCVKLVLWDEDRERLISFREARAIA